MYTNSTSTLGHRWLSIISFHQPPIVYAWEKPRPVRLKCGYLSSPSWLAFHPAFFVIVRSMLLRRGWKHRPHDRLMPCKPVLIPSRHESKTTIIRRDGILYGSRSTRPGTAHSTCCSFIILSVRSSHSDSLGFHPIHSTTQFSPISISNSAAPKRTGCNTSYLERQLGIDPGNSPSPGR